MRPFINLFLSLIFASTLSVFAQNNPTPESWTLQQCFDYAEKNNIQLKQAALQITSAEGNLMESKAAILPDLNGFFTQSVNLGRTVVSATNSLETITTNNSNLGLSTNFTLYNGGVVKHTIEQRDLQVGLAKLQVEEANNNLQLQILSAYMQALLAEEQLKVLQNQATLTKEQRVRMNKLVEAGVRAPSDLLDLDAQIASDDINLVNAENNINASYLTIAQILDYYKPIRIVKPNIEGQLPNQNEVSAIRPDQVYDAALRTQPQFKVRDLQTQIAEKSYDIAKGYTYPSVSLFARYSTDYSNAIKNFIPTGEIEQVPTSLTTLGGEGVLLNSPITNQENIPYFTQLTDNWRASVGVSINVPIFNNYQVKNGIEQARINIENTVYSKDLAKNQLRREIEQAYLDANATAKRYKANQSNMEILKKSLAQTERRFELGLVNAFDYLTAKNNLASAELNLQSAIYEYIFRLKILDYYQGKDLGL
ncbi:MAG: TolC family protein [Chitinophagales bacterium]